MPSRHDPADSLHHIIENGERVARYLADLDREEFEQNEAMRDAVERCIERVCEAAYRLGERAEELMPGQPWSDIRGMGISATACLRPGGRRYRLEHGAGAFA